ncbi:MAG TPA: YdcF family protein [Vicinamibacterales bacterium]|nr:YdcF family protein [Vicinamibacterales bacterium]
MLLPGSTPFLIVGLALCLVLLRIGRARRWGWRLLVLLVAGYWAIGSMAGARILARGLTIGYAPLRSAARADGATAVVILGGGNDLITGRRAAVDLLSPSSVDRVLEGARIYALLDHPWVMASGGVTDHIPGAESEAASMRTLLMTLGVPADRILLDPRSLTTRQQAERIPPRLRAHGISRFVLVTSPIHMRRALGAFRAVGWHPVPAISAGLFTGWRGSWVLPTRSGLRLSQEAIHEYGGWLYYWLRGWLSP